MAYLQKETFQYKVETESAAQELIEKEKEKSQGLVTYGTKYRTRKENKEVVESWYVVTVTHDYTK